ncbi:MAG: thiamine pyrophosphate-dependent dehydrogenase E1 component subunit alpha [Acidobacteriales bacterium]|nr:thiamine pyrophosphate-dependent dehydrogenase E1 component subunit alpha [Terriglobales bacterium]
MKANTETKPSKPQPKAPMPAKSAPAVTSNGPGNQVVPLRKNPNGIPDYRAEVPNFHTVEEWADGKLRYTVTGDFDAPVPAIRESKYLNKDQSLEIYRYMLLNRKMEQALENLFKQQKVIGGVYLGLGQEGCSVASAYALDKFDWIAPMIRNQGAMLVRGFRPAETMMQYMAKVGAPTKGRDSGSHYGDIHEKNCIAPISHLGDSLPVIAGCLLGARIQGRNVAGLAYIGDGGQSTGPCYEGFNFAAVQKLGVVLIMEHNLWAYSTPVELQFACRDLADRALGYGVPGAIIDGTDPNQVYDVVHEACERGRRGEGATLIEAKMMRMKGHAMHDAALYVPKPYFEYWKKRDCMGRFEQYLMGRGWLTAKQNEELIRSVDEQINKDRDEADASPFPNGEDAAANLFKNNAETIPFKYGPPKVKKVSKDDKLGEASNVSHYK